MNFFYKKQLKNVFQREVCGIKRPEVKIIHWSKEGIVPTKSDAAPESKEKKVKEERDKMTIYISKSLLKRFKIHAIEIDKDYSQLAEEAFLEYLEKHNKPK